jgi:hypothetical protein
MSPPDRSSFFKQLKCSRATLGYTRNLGSKRRVIVAIAANSLVDGPETRRIIQSFDEPELRSSLSAFKAAFKEQAEGTSEEDESDYLPEGV